MGVQFTQPIDAFNRKIFKKKTSIPAVKNSPASPPPKPITAVTLPNPHRITSLSHHPIPMIAVRPKKKEMEVHPTLFVTQSKAACSTDEDSAESSEEMELPRSVGQWRRPKKMAYVHSQILRIREEDSHLGESSFSAKEKVPSHVDLVLFARPILPSSPLKNTFNALH